METISIEDLRTDGGTQPRAAMDIALVAEYAEAMKRGDTFPPIRVVYDGANYWVVDGFHRKAAAQRAGLDSYAVDIVQGDKEHAVWLSLAANANHGKRRTREDVQRAIETALKGWGHKYSDNAIAQHVGCSPTTVGSWRGELESTFQIGKSCTRTGADGRTIDTSNIGRKPKTDPVDKARRDLEELPKAAQAKLATKEADLRAVKKEQKRKERIEKINEIADGGTEIDTSKRYPVIYADPPWRYEHAKTDNRQIENQYPTMGLAEICDLPVAELATPDAVLFMWATSPKLAESLRVVESWGFTYRTCMVWDKEVMGMGYYARQQHELLLIATRGSLPVPEPQNRPRSVWREKRGKHSAKPHAFYTLIRDMYPEYPAIELFCRTPQPGWDVWGNQSGGADVG